MIQRSILPFLKTTLKSYPAVVLIGPRQCGKTTLAKSLNQSYYDLENELDQIKLDAEWEGVLSSKELIVLDEVQSYPKVFSKLRSAIDSDRRRKGRFLLLGSIAPSLMKQASESLAGRMAILELSPFLFSEPKFKDYHSLWIYGGYPDGGLKDNAVYPFWQKNYLDLISERDLPNWGLVAKPSLTKKLFQLLAHMHGQIWNASEIGGNLGLSYHTINSYMEYLEGSFLIKTLSPYHANIKKRIIKSPRVYWRDSGLLHYLLMLPPGKIAHLKEQIFTYPWVGKSFEGFVIEQLCSSLKSQGVVFNPYFFRTSDGKEMDLILEMNGKRYGVEIKTTSTPSKEMVVKTQSIAELLQLDRVFLVTRSSEKILTNTFFLGDLITVANEIVRSNSNPRNTESAPKLNPI